MSVAGRTRKLLLASAAMAAGVGFASYAIGAPPPAGPRAGGFLAVYDTVDAHVAAAKRVAARLMPAGVPKGFSIPAQESAMKPPI